MAPAIAQIAATATTLPCSPLLARRSQREKQDKAAVRKEEKEKIRVKVRMARTKVRERQMRRRSCACSSCEGNVRDQQRIVDLATRPR
jgi:hypothetical protein